MILRSNISIVCGQEPQKTARRSRRSAPKQMGKEASATQRDESELRIVIAHFRGKDLISDSLRS